MNQRAQRETSGAVGDFCVKCHAPMAVQRAMTTDGLNLDTLPKKMKGVTCYFCHAAESIEGTHNNPLTLAKDDTLFGPFSDPVAATPHKGVYSRLLDGATLESAVDVRQLPRHPEPAGRARRADVRGVAGHAVRDAAQRPGLRRAAT